MVLLEAPDVSLFLRVSVCGCGCGVGIGDGGCEAGDAVRGAGRSRATADASSTLTGFAPAEHAMPHWRTCVSAPAQRRPCMLASADSLACMHAHSLCGRHACGARGRMALHGTVDAACATHHAEIAGSLPASRDGGTAELSARGGLQACACVAAPSWRPAGHQRTALRPTIDPPVISWSTLSHMRGGRACRRPHGAPLSCECQRWLGWVSACCAPRASQRAGTSATTTGRTLVYEYTVARTRDLLKTPPGAPCAENSKSACVSTSRSVSDC